jgi:hypothetical protein
MFTLLFIKMQCFVLRYLEGLSKTECSGVLNSTKFARQTYPCKHNLNVSKVKVKVILRPTVSRPVYLGTKHPSGAYDQILIIVWQLRVWWCGAPSLTRGWVCRLQFLLTLANAVIFWSESRRTRRHILLSHIWDFPFRRLLRLAGSRWRYSTPPPHGTFECVF